jgi:outer membrane protein assembly factor BamB
MIARRLLLPLLCAIYLVPAYGQDGARDPHIVKKPENLKENPRFLSPPILQRPIYGCASSVVVKGFVPGAELLVFVSGSPTVIGHATSLLSAGQNIPVSITFTVGQKIVARQKFNGATSGPSNIVTVTNYQDDYPSGLPKPRLAPAPCLDCGRAVGIADVIPGAWVHVMSEKALGGGTFSPATQIGSVSDFPYTFVSPAFAKGDRIHAESGICTATSPPSDPEIVQPDPAAIPAPALDPIHQGVQIAVVWGPGGNPQLPLNGADLEVFTDPGAVHVGGQPTPGGGGQQIGIPPASTSHTYFATQALCTKSPPSTPIHVLPCAQQPPAKIRPPIAGDTQVQLTDFVPGAEILIFDNGVEIGNGGGPLISLSHPIKDGDTIVVVQKIGKCESRLVYEIRVSCSNALGGDARACSAEWPAFRHDGLRSASQPIASPLSDPNAVKKLAVRWRFPATGSVGAFFRGSPVVSGGRVFVGSGDGHVFAIDAATGAALWQFPLAGQPALVSQYGFGVHAGTNPSSAGVASSPTIATLREFGEALIFAAPDQSIGTMLGSGRLFALRTSDGSVIWKSPELAPLTGLTVSSTSELHQNLGYSSPLVLGERVYVGIADHGDSPIQAGHVVAVNLGNGAPVAGFAFASTGTRGGGIWSSLAGGLSGNGVYATTGNARFWNGGSQSQPTPDHSLSMVRLDPNTGSMMWELKPVPFDLDGDPDWASGVQLMNASCGPVALGTMKDGWSYAANAGGPGARWQFPPTGIPFHAGDGTVHGDTRYQFPGAAWDDIFIAMVGGENIAADVNAGFGRLHALNVCAAGGSRVRWSVDVPSAALGATYQIGPPSVTRGVIYVGTAAGHLVAIADPSIWPTQGSRCSRPDVAASNCIASGYSFVPIPSVLLDLPLNSGRVLTEPALAGKRVIVATEGGVVFMLDPGP